MRNVISLGTLLFFVGSIWAKPYFKNVYWDNFPTLSKADEVAQQAGSRDVETQIRGAITYFSRANAEDNIEYMKEAESRLRKVLRRNRKDSDLQAFYGMVSLGLAGMSDALSDKITKSNAGIGALERAQLQDPDNIEILYMYLVAVWQVPTSFKNKNETMRKFGLQWLDSYPQLKDRLEQPEQDRFELFNEAVLLILAEVENRLGATDDARTHFSMVKRELSDQVSGLDKLYEKMEKQFS